MPENVFGLPTHAIVVHATVVLLPLASLVVLLHAVWPGAKRRLGVATPVLALVALVLVPLSTQSGEGLEHRLPHNALIERHAELADGMLPWAAGLFVVALGLWLLDRRRATRPTPRWLPLVAVVLAVVAVVGTAQQIVRVGHAGAAATWADVPAAVSGGHGGDD